MCHLRRLLAASLVLALVPFACGDDKESDGPRGADDAGSNDTGGGVTGAPDPNLRVAFIGDQGLGPDPEAVLQLIKDEGTDFVIHPGDFDYDDDPDAWDAQIDKVLGPDYPYFGTIGNHDVDAWPGYKEKLEQRAARIPGIECTGGDMGIRSACTYRGLHFILSGVGTSGFFDHIEYLNDELTSNESVWSLCTWHKNRADFQAGGKGNEVLLSAYEACADAGAMVVNAHEHSYARTLTLTDVGNAAGGYGAAGSPSLMELKKGSTFVVVSGIAGQGLRDYDPSHDDDTWWATLYAGGKHLKNGELVSDSTYAFGALFVDFHIDGDPKKARGFFKNVAGEIVDDFSIVTE